MIKWDLALGTDCDTVVILGIEEGNLPDAVVVLRDQVAGYHCER